MRTDPAALAPDSPELADAAADHVAAYVHIPFCRSVCPYCDFAVVEGTDLADRYVEAVIVEIDRAEPFERPLDSVAVGGGTPTSLSPAALARLVGALEERFGFGTDVEISIEANPEDVDPVTCLRLADAGFGRISLGVQSFDDGILRSLGRNHTAAQARAAVESAVEVMPRVSVDLIFGTPGETLESWEHSVRTALDSGIGHLSTYALTVELGTPLSRAVRAGAPAPDPDLQADAHAVACEAAADAGLVRYETSNHARPGETVGYNLITWAQGEYAAFGNGAHRHRNGVRSWNVRRVDRYVERIEAGESAVSGEEHLEGWDRDAERVMLGLRRAAGVLPGEVGDALLASDSGRMLVDAGILTTRDGRLVVSEPMLENEVARAVLGLEQPQ
jgi:putative oxygen-independent coproporphyrinogen III oxidase